MIKRPFYAFLTALILGFNAFAESPYDMLPVPKYEWAVDINGTETRAFDAYHGETVVIDITFKSGMIYTGLTLYWQEAGMGSDYWSAPVAVEGGRHRAVFTPGMDTGAKLYNCFVGIPGVNYRAAFQLRFRNSPGADPAELPLPVKTLDFEKIEVLNAPWENGCGVDGESVTNIVDSLTSDVVRQSDIQEYSEFGMLPPNKVADAQTTFSTIKGIRSKVTSMQKTVNAIPEWALQENPPEGMTDDAVTWDGSHLKTKDGTKTIASADVGAAPASVSGVAADALAYASGVFNYMNANTNAWFAGTNYVVGVSSVTRHKFAFENGMDLSTVPCSMALWERRDGEKSVVWDQRDWVSWYWSFKASQMQARINATNEVLRAEIAAKAPAAWAKRTAATGLVNPDETTTWIDTKTVTLSPGMAWETVATVDGCGYWTIVGNGATIGGSDKSPLLSIKDFEGNEVLKIKKTASYMAYLNSADFVAGGMRDADGRICFDVRSDVQPVGEFSTTLVNEDFVAEDSDGCPALYTWENIGGGKYRIHFILKPGIVSNACFARFKVEVQGETTVEYSCGQTISGGLIYNGVKIAPVVTQGAAIGTTVTWKVVR